MEVKRSETIAGLLQKTNLCCRRTTSIQSALLFAFVIVQTLQTKGCFAPQWSFISSRI